MEILKKLQNSKIFDEISEKDIKALHFCFKTRVFEVKKGEILAYVHANNEEKLKEVYERIKTVIKISDGEVKVKDTILGVIGH